MFNLTLRHNLDVALLWRCRRTDHGSLIIWLGGVRLMNPASTISYSSKREHGASQLDTMVRKMRGHTFADR